MLFINLVTFGQLFSAVWFQMYLEFLNANAVILCHLANWHQIAKRKPRAYSWSVEKAPGNFLVLKVTRKW